MQNSKPVKQDSEVLDQVTLPKPHAHRASSVAEWIGGGSGNSIASVDMPLNPKNNLYIDTSGMSRSLLVHGDVGVTHSGKMTTVNDYTIIPLQKHDRAASQLSIYHHSLVGSGAGSSSQFNGLVKGVSATMSPFTVGGQNSPRSQVANNHNSSSNTATVQLPALK